MSCKAYSKILLAQRTTGTNIKNPNDILIFPINENKVPNKIVLSRHENSPEKTNNVNFDRTAFLRHGSVNIF